MLTIDTIILGPLQTNCYVLRSGQECWIVDPSLWPTELMEFLQTNKLHPQRVLLTHGHGDHIAGANDLREAFPGIVVACPKGDAAMLGDAALNMSAAFNMPLTVGAADELLTPGQSLHCGDDDVLVLDTAGHTPGGVSFYCPSAEAVITGDALFFRSIGRCDIPDASMTLQVENIRLNLLSLPEETRVLPGHGEETTIGSESQSNPYL